LRLALLYSSLTAVVFCILGVLVYESVRRSLIALVDRSLEATLAQIAADVVYMEGVPAFDSNDLEDEDERTAREAADLALEDTNATARVLSADSARVLSSLGPAGDLPLWPVSAGGFSTQQAADGPWRVYSRALLAPGGEREAWLQVIGSLDLVTETLGSVLRHLLIGLPVLLLLAGAAGAALSARALRPIEDVARTAASITGDDLTRRIDYRGSVSEVARLAASFDRMLDGLQRAFERERRFTSDAAHELRTPLTTLKGQIDVALRRTRSPLVYRRTLAGLEYVDRLVRLATTSCSWRAWITAPGTHRSPSP